MDVDPVGAAMSGIARVTACLLCVAAWASAQQQAPDDVVKSVTPGLVILTGKSGKKETVATGAVVRRVGSRTLILAPQQFVAESAPETLEATIEAGTDRARRVPAKVLFTDTAALVVMVWVEEAGLPALKLDGPVPSGFQEGFLIGAASASAFGQRAIQMTGRTTRDSPVPWGTLNPFDIGRSWDGAAAVNAKGEFLGFFQGGTGPRQRCLLLHDYLASYWRGLTVGASWSETEVKPGEIRGTFRTFLLDPDSKVRGLTLLLARQDQVVRAAVPGEGGTWNGMVGSPQETIPLTVKDGEVQGSFTVRYPLPEDTTFVGQVRIERETGVTYAAPELYLAPFSKTKTIGKKDDEWIEGKGSPGKSAEPGTPLARRKRSVEDATVTELDVMTLQGVDGARACLSEDGAYLYVAGAPNLLRKIRTADLVEERQLTLPFDSNFAVRTLAMTKAGLIAYGGKPVEVAIVEPGTLALRKKVFIHENKGDPRQKGPTSGLGYWGGTTLLASPALSRALLSVTPDSGNGEMALVLDVAGGRIVRDFLLADVSKKSGEVAKRHAEAPPHLYAYLKDGAFTPDGRALVLNGGGALQRFRFSGSDLVLEECGPIIADSSSAVAMSPDGRYVTLLNPRGHRLPSDHPPLSNVMFIYKVSNLQKPWAALRLSGERQALGVRQHLAFDRVARQLYLVDQKDFTVFNSMGVKTRALPLLDGNGTASDVLVHPGGLKLAVVSTSGVCWIEMPPPK